MAKGLMIEVTKEEGGYTHYSFTYRNTDYLLVHKADSAPLMPWSLWATRKGFRPSPPRVFSTLAEVEAVAKGFAGLEALITSLNEDGGKIIH